MTITKGTRLEANEVIDFIGAGGMGEVYIFRMTRLLNEVDLVTRTTPLPFGERDWVRGHR